MNDDGPKETATSSEFDAFLATREKEASSAVSSDGTTSNRGGRTLQNAEDEQALFSLWDCTADIAAVTLKNASDYRANGLLSDYIG